MRLCGIQVFRSYSTPCFGPRTCDRGRTNIPKTFRRSQSGLPLLAPTMQAGQDSDGGGIGNVYDACSDCVVVLALGDLVSWRHFVRASRGPPSFYYQLNDEVRAVLCTRTRTRIPSHAHAHTHVDSHLQLCVQADRAF